MSESENPKPSFILALDRRYNTKSGKGRFCMTYYVEGKAPHEKTTGMIPWHVTNAHAYNPGEGDWVNLLRWYDRTKDLPGAREAYDAETKTSQLKEEVSEEKG